MIVDVTILTLLSLLLPGQYTHLAIIPIKTIAN